MSKKVFVILVFLFVTVSVGGYRVFTTRVQAVAGLKVESSPPASVFLNDQLVGSTPFDQRMPPGEYSLKLIPEDSSMQAVSWQGTVNLSPSVLFYVNRALGASELVSAGEMLSLEETGGSVDIDVSSMPNAAVVLLDGIEKGVSPIILRDVIVGDHDVSAKAPGFLGRTVRVSAKAGYTVHVDFQLALSSPDATAPSDLSQPQELPDQTDDSQKRVSVKDTPTGFLRVRSKPTTASQEVGQVQPGDVFSLLTEEDGWYKIAYEEGKEGWISGRYADIQE